jgi:hypothetical protein
MISIEKEVASSSASASDSRRELVERILASAQFSKSERLASLLTYVCDLTLKGQADQISEQNIGGAVFGRSPHYDSANDGIVRTQVSRLRQKLDLFFDGEGIDEPIRIVIPRGGYVPFFVPRSSQEVPTLPLASAAITEPVIPSGLVSKAQAPRSGYAALAWMLVGVLSIALLALFFRNRESAVQEASARSHPLWSLLFHPGQRTMVVPGDSGLVLWQGVKRQKLDLGEYLSGNYRTATSAANPFAPVDATNLANRRYTSIVDLEIAKTLSHIADSKKGQLQVRYARDVRPNDLKEGDVVFVGAATANPWVELFEPNMNFVFSYDPIHQIDSVLNRAPAAGEPAKWDSNLTDVQRRVYGVVAFLPNLSGKGSVLILEGTSMAGTECAWDFVADDSALLPFLDRIKRPDGSTPYFQVVLGTNNVSGSSVKSNILAWRIVK